MLRHYVSLKAGPPRIRVAALPPGGFLEFLFRGRPLLGSRACWDLTLTGKEAGARGSARPHGRWSGHPSPRPPRRYATEPVRHGLSIALCDQLRSGGARAAWLKRGPFHPG